MKEKIANIERIKDNLVDFLAGKMSAGMDELDTADVGEVTDMIKDLSESVKECWEACYYKSIVEAMEKADEGEGRMGYDDWRYASGRFATTGRGTRSGYMPPYMGGVDYYSEIEDGMPGYTQTDTGNRGRSGMNGTGRMGYTGDPIDVLSKMWQDADDETKHLMKSALEEMTHSM